MKNFYNVHQERILIVVTVVLLGFTTTYFVWGILKLADVFALALNPAVVQSSVVHYDIQGAKDLGLQATPLPRQPSATEAPPSIASSTLSSTPSVAAPSSSPPSPAASSSHR